jgi:hypothetical protein
MKKKCDHLKDALELWRKEKAKLRDYEYPLSYEPFARLYRYSSIRILYETEKGRVVQCYLCKKVWYTQAEYSKHLSMQR